MSTYLTIDGCIRIPKNYEYKSIIKTLDLFQWIKNIIASDKTFQQNSESEEEELDDDIYENEEDIDIFHPENNTVIWFNRNWMRNYGRYIENDLLRLSQYSTITADIFSYSSDGMYTAEHFILKNGELTRQSLFDAPIIIVKKPSMMNENYSLFCAIFTSLGYNIELHKIDQNNTQLYIK